MKNKTLHWLVCFALIALSCYAVVNIFGLNARIAQKQEIKQALEEQINAQMLANQEIKENMEGELSDEEIAALAREKLSYSLPGERIFVDITGK